MTSRPYRSSKQDRRSRWDHNQHNGVVVMVVVEHRQRFTKHRRDEVMELQSNELERGIKGLVCPLGVPPPLYIQVEGCGKHPLKALGHN